MKIAMIGLGAVALADALALGRSHEVVVTGPVPDRVEAINAGVYGLTDSSLDAYLATYPISLRATLDTRAALDGAQMVFVSAPLSMDPETGQLRTVEMESRIELAAQLLPHVPIVIRSAVPIGFTDQMRARLKGAKLVYAPEFSRAGMALGDILYPSLLVVGECGNLGAHVGQVLAQAALADAVPLRQIPPTEAEALRHLSILCQDSASATAVDPELGNLARPLSKSDAGNTPDLASVHSDHITRLADHVVTFGARQVGYYLTPPTAMTERATPNLKAALEAFGLKTHSIDQAASSLASFKHGCDVVVAHHVTSDLLDIRDKVLASDYIAVA